MQTAALCGGPAGLGGPDVDAHAAASSSQSEHLSQSCEKSQFMSELQSKLGEFEQLKEKEVQLAPESQNEADFAANEPVDKDHTLRIAGMQYRLNEYDTELIKKQQLYDKMFDNKNNTHENKQTVTAEMETLIAKIDSLEKERDELLKSRVDQKKDRIKQIEAEFQELKKKEREFKRTLKIQEENEKQCERLRTEIQNIKTERVKLIKQIKADSDNFRKYKTDKEKEVIFCILLNKDFFCLFLILENSKIIIIKTRTAIQSMQNKKYLIREKLTQNEKFSFICDCFIKVKLNVFQEK